MIYTMNFDPRYVGYEATVTDADGVEVAGSPVTLDANGDATIDLALGDYRAAVFNSVGPYGDGYSVVNLLLDVPASIQTDDTEATSALSAHISNPTTAHNATAIAFTPAGGLSSTSVGGALGELDAEKANQTGGVVAVTGPTLTTMTAGTKYVWTKTDPTTGDLIDIITGVVS